MIGWHPNVAGNLQPGTLHASTVSHDARVSVSVVFHGSPLLLASFGRPSDTGAPLVVLDSEYAVRRSLESRHHAALAVLERDKGAVAVQTVEIETPFLSVVHLVEGE